MKIYYYFTTALSSYRIRAYNTPLLIKPPLQPNLNKPPLFCLKSPLLKAFWGKNPKNFNKPPPKNPQIFINRRRTIGASTVFEVHFNLLNLMSDLYVRINMHVL